MWGRGREEDRKGKVREGRGGKAREGMGGRRGDGSMHPLEFSKVGANALCNPLVTLNMQMMHYDVQNVNTVNYARDDTR